MDEETNEETETVDGDTTGKQWRMCERGGVVVCVKRRY
jgi:hypothetical protein